VRSRLLVAALGVIVILGSLAWVALAAHPGVLPDALGAAAPIHEPAPLLLEGDQAERRRTALIRSARVRVEGPAATSRHSSSPDAALAAGEAIECRYVAEAAGGTSAKFDCMGADGRQMRVKYGRNPEIHAETAAARLLTILGYPADRVSIVRRVRCYGCPRYPFAAMQVLQLIGANGALAPHGSNRGYTDFEWAAVEEPFPGLSIRTRNQEGWAWYELEASMQPAAEIGALQLLAAFLVHWDNKSENQRLVCLQPAPSRTDCTDALAMIGDLGSTFGPTKANLAAWRAQPVWADRATCTISMRHLPFNGATFADVRIPESGRQQIAARLLTLTRDDVSRLFADARFPALYSATDDRRDLDAWTDAFFARVDRISHGEPCPQ
jgi:hypothetical protein